LRNSELRWSVFRASFIQVCISNGHVQCLSKSLYWEFWYIGYQLSHDCCLSSSRHVYKTFLRFVLRYVLRCNLGKKLGTPKYERRSCLMMSPDDIFRIS
jgi:hypothetical protein